MPSYTTTQLVNTIKTKGLVPTNQLTFTTDQILQIADEEMQTGVVPLIMTAREEYFVKFEDFTINSGQSEYELPYRSIGSKLREITVVNGESEYKIPLFQADQIADRNDPFGFNAGTVAYLRANKVVLSPGPVPSLGQTLRMYYFNRRNTLVQETAAGRIDAIDTNTNTITLSNVPTTFSISSQYDFIKSKPGFENLAEDRTPTAINGTLFTFASLPSGLVVGDYLALSGESPIVQIPVEFQPVLAQRVIVRILEAIGDTTGVQVARTKLVELEKNTLDLISPRVDGNPKKIVNIYGPLNAGGRFSRWWRS